MVLVNNDESDLDFGFEKREVTYPTKLFSYYPTVEATNEIQIKNYNLIKDYNQVQMRLNNNEQYILMELSFRTSQYLSGYDYIELFDGIHFDPFKFQHSSRINYFKENLYTLNNNLLSNISILGLDNVPIDKSMFNSLMYSFYGFDSTDGNKKLFYKNIIMAHDSNPGYLFISNNGVAIGKNFVSELNSFEISSSLKANIDSPINFNNAVNFNNSVCFNDDIDLQNLPFYYKPGNYIVTTITGGYISNNKKNCVFEITTPKFLNCIKKVTIDSIVGDIRPCNGGYIMPHNHTNKNNWLAGINKFTCTASIRNENHILIKLSTDNALQYSTAADASPTASGTVTNNTPINCVFTIQFSLE